MNKQAGFTLVELVVVIVILGLLAATALPKFINVTTQARGSSVEGVAGGLRSAASLAQSQYVLNGDNTATSVVMSGATVTTLAGTSVGGRPTTDAAGISVAMPDPDGFSVTYSATTAVYVPTGIPATNTNCRATYTATSTTDPVVVDISNC